MERTLAGIDRCMHFLTCVFVFVLGSFFFLPTEAVAGGYCGFIDIAGDEWYVSDEVIGYSVEHGLLTGYGDGRFGPNDSVTRAQAVLVLWRMAGSPLVVSDHFSDVDYSSYYGHAVSWARAVGVSSGYSGDNRFGPDDPVTREQLAKFIASYAEMSGVDVRSNTDAMSFADADSISSWAKESFSWCSSEGIITGSIRSGVKYADPQRGALRCQLAKIASVLHRDVLVLGGADAKINEAERQMALASNPTVVLSTPDKQDAERKIFTGVVRMLMGYDGTLGHRVPTYYIEIPNEVEVIGTQYAGVKSNRLNIYLNNPESYLGKTISLSTKLGIRPTASIPTADVSEIHCNSSWLVRVF